MATLKAHFLMPQRIKVPGDCRDYWRVIRRKDGTPFGKGQFSTKEDCQGWIDQLTRDVKEVVDLMERTNA